MEALAPEGGGLSIGTFLAGAASLSFIIYVGYKIHKKREEIRNTIELLTNNHNDFVKDLEAIVEIGGESLV